MYKFISEKMFFVVVLFFMNMKTPDKLCWSEKSCNLFSITDESVHYFLDELIFDL